MNNNYRVIVGYLRKRADDLGFGKFLQKREQDRKDALAEGARQERERSIDKFVDKHGPDALQNRIREVQLDKDMGKGAPEGFEDFSRGIFDLLGLKQLDFDALLDQVESGKLSRSKAKELALVNKDNSQFRVYLVHLIKAGVLDENDPAIKYMDLKDSQEYNDWKNFKTWNVNLWLTTEAKLQSASELRAKQYGYTGIVAAAKAWSKKNHGVASMTPDGVYWDDPAIDREAILTSLTDY